MSALRLCFLANAKRLPQGQIGVTSAEAELNAQERAIVDLLNERGPLGRPQIGGALRIGRMSALRSLKKLAEGGVVAVEGRGRGTKYRV